VKDVLIIVLGLAAIGLLWSFWQAYGGPGELRTPTACTLDAKLCPDGTAVGRTGPNCEFAKCPGE
jgi:hypothetical protein